MKQVGVLEAKTHLSRLLEEIERTGEPVVITRHGKPVATISAGVSEAGREATRQAAARLKAWRADVEPDPGFDKLSWEELKAGARP
ncbi:MAG: type II toxin-antitoxin system Phd/YefM family antitoxin [Oceanicaulis sp.]